MGRISVVSVLAGALSALAALEVLLAIAGAVGVAINGGTSFATTSDRAFRTVLGVVSVVALFGAFTFGGYVSGRMARRGGATHGILAGVVGVVLAAAAAAAVVRTGTDNGLAHLARHIQVAATWQQWRNFAVLAAVVSAAAMVLGGLTGGFEGERWHGKLLARAVDPNFGPEADERAEARKRLTDAEVARLSAASHAGRLTAAEKAAATEPTVVRAEAVAPTTTRQPTVVTTSAGHRTPLRTGDAPGQWSRESATAGPASGTKRDTVANATTTTDTARRGPRHLLGRR